jgi:hypothetical protein
LWKKDVYVSMTQHDLDSVSWIDIDLLEDEGKFILMLVCTTHEKAGRFLDLLRNNPFGVYARVSEQSKEYSIEIKFTDCKSQTGCHTKRTKENYNRLSWLEEQKLTHIGAAYRDEDNRLLPVPELLLLKSEVYVV